MIYLICPGIYSFVGDLVEKALVRSFSKSQVTKIGFSLFQDLMGEEENAEHVFVMISPLEEWGDVVGRGIRKKKVKVILLGALPNSIGFDLGLKLVPIPGEFIEKANCEPAPLHDLSKSPLGIRYRRISGGLVSPITERPFVRYDFADEWNNLGFGAIRMDGSPWSLQQCVCFISPEITPLADIVLDEKVVSAYSCYWDFERSSVLWFNRMVGPIDSQEWRLVEEFVSSYRFTQTPCLPSLPEIPYGYDGAVTMRLDCDEDIASARFLYQFYRDRKLPFSLAVHTSLLLDSFHHPFLREVHASGGTLMSHSASHPKDWGGSYERAFTEAQQSREALFSVSGKWVEYAVSPFHQTPGYALNALSDAGYSGVIGGVINCDPEFLMARGGEVLGVGAGFVGHSQQCMLHGDCLLSGSEPLRVYKESFDIAFRGRAIFGFLDHPFSDRYQYGWKDEKVRLDAHKSLLDYISGKEKIIFLSEGQALDFLREKERINIHKTSSGFRFVTTSARQVSNSPLIVGAEWGGRSYPIRNGMEIKC